MPPDTISRLIMFQKYFCPSARWGSSQRSTRLPSLVWGPLREREGGERERKRKREKGRGRGSGERGASKRGKGLAYSALGGLTPLFAGLRIAKVLSSQSAHRDFAVWPQRGQFRKRTRLLPVDGNEKVNWVVNLSASMWKCAPNFPQSDCHCDRRQHLLYASVNGVENCHRGLHH